MQEEISRRAFIMEVASGVAMTALLSTCAQPGDNLGSQRPGSRRLDRIGIQLYTVRRFMEREPEPTLAALAAMGYREVEFAGLYGRTAEALRGMLTSHDLMAPAGHVSLQDIRTNLPRLLDDAATLGWRWIVCPWIDAAERTMSGYRRVASDLNRAAASAGAVGIRLAYHNHAFEFAPLTDGTLPYDLLLAELDPQLVDMELDLYWMVHGGSDPLTYLHRHAGRFPLFHLKDRTLAGEMVDVGKGAIDFRPVFATVGTAATRHYFVEHDNAPSPHSFARNSFAYLRELRF